jgi:ATP-dependent Clp protease adapter protein ClpS
VSEQNQSDVLSRIAINHSIEEPKKHNVIYINDDKTSYEFVILSLMSVFGYDEQAALNLAVQVNDKGSGVVATLSKEIADQKASEVILLARHNGFPLVVEVHPIS